MLEMKTKTLEEPRCIKGPGDYVTGTALVLTPTKNETFVPCFHGFLMWILLLIKHYQQAWETRNDILRIRTGEEKINNLKRKSQI